jgi:glycosyltransferase involved in cell wall biosynthesis
MIAKRPTVIIFCDHLLYLSETFIRAQAQSLRQFSPVYAGSRRVAGLDLPEASTYVINQGGATGRIKEICFKLAGKAPTLVRRLRALDPALVHAHFGPDGLRALPLSRQLGLPLIVTFHGSDATAIAPQPNEVPYGHRRYLARKKVLQDGASKFLAVSEFIRRKLLEQHFAADKVLVHYTGVDTSFFSPSTEPRPGETDPLILFVGRLSERKGPEHLIRAMARVQEEFPKASLVLVGDGPQRKELEAQARTSLKRYSFQGAQTPQQVRAWMERANVFSVPSVKAASGGEEAFGMVFAEAQAMGKPVVAFASGGVVEAVEHGRTGFLAPERDWRKLAEYLTVLLRDQALQHKFGMAGRERVLRLFNLEKQTSTLEKIYWQVTTEGMPFRGNVELAGGHQICHES